MAGSPGGAEPAPASRPTASASVRSDSCQYSSRARHRRPPPLRLDPAWLAELRAALPELPAARRARYVDELGLSPYDAAVLVNDEAMSVAFVAIRAAAPGLPVKEIANFVAELLFSLFSWPRARALGQYTFALAVKTEAGSVSRPDWLYRSYSEHAKTMVVAEADPRS